MKRSEGDNHTFKLEKLSDYIQSRAIAHVGHIFRAKTDDPIRKVIWIHRAPDIDNNIQDTEHSKKNQSGKTKNMLDRNTFGESGRDTST